MTWATGAGLGAGRARTTAPPPFRRHLCVKEPLLGLTPPVGPPTPCGHRARLAARGLEAPRPGAALFTRPGRNRPAARPLPEMKSRGRGEGVPQRGTGCAGGKKTSYLRAWPSQQ